MSSSHPFLHLFAKPVAPSRLLRRSFHPSKSLNVRPKPKYKSIKASELGLVNSTASRHFPPYSEADREALAEMYSPAQMAAIQAGEEAIDPEDLAIQGALREDTMGLGYMDDLSQIHPVVDKPVRAPDSNHDPKLRLKDGEELADDIVNWVQKLPEDASGEEWTEFEDNLRLTVGKEEAEFNPPSSLAPELPQMYKPQDSAKENTAISPAMRKVMLQTGFTSSDIARFRVKLLVTRRVVNQTKLGKIQSQYFLSVAGNGKGMLGLGEAKSSEMQGAKEMSYMNAIKNMKPIPRYEERTIFGDVRGKVGATELELMTRPPGIADLAARVTRARNPMNTVKATMQALLSQQLPEDLARARGKKLVDVRRVYYSGNT
ncbi:28S ribosomal protein S5, mitochondrial [Pseudocyphellaria aurata]|nr:28S ribosomal protein S5, mitochondrial [Pseudocyphellaria aurata]